MSDDFKDGPHKSEVVAEHVTSISVPIIPDADTYTGRMFTITLPPGSFAPEGCILPFTEENGRLVEAWMRARNINPAKEIGQFVFELEGHGCIRISHRRKARDE